MKAETFLYLVTRGRNSGLARRQEVWFVQLDGLFYLLSDSQERAEWVKNIEANADVSFSIGNRRNESSERHSTRGCGRILDERTEAELCARVRASMYVKYRWTGGWLVEVEPQAQASA